MAGNVPATHTFKGDGVTRVFPISTKILGDDYVRIEIDSEYIFDRSSWDIVNNSIIFTVAPTLNSTVLIKVAESVEAVGLLDNQSTADIIEANIPVINDVYNNLDKIENVNDNLDVINNVDNIKTDINIVADKMPTLEIISESLGDLQAIKNHNNLTGRDQANAHPISAITGLQETLDGLSNDGGLFPSLTSDYLTRDTYLSCKVSPTELRAVHIDSVLNPRYKINSISNQYTGIIDKDVFGVINNIDAPSIYSIENTTFWKNLVHSSPSSAMMNQEGITVKCPLYKDALLSIFSSTTLRRTTLAPNELSSGSQTIALSLSDSYFNKSSSLVVTNTHKLIATPSSNPQKYILIYDILTNTPTYVDILSLNYNRGFGDMQLHPNGKVYLTPYNASSIIELNPETATYRLIGSFTPNAANYLNSFLAPNGCIYYIPFKADKITEYNPYTDTLTSYGSFTLNIDKFKGSALGVDGNIYMISEKGADYNLYKFNPITKEITTKSLLTLLDKTSAVGDTNVIDMISGIDGNIYIACSTSSQSHNIFRVNDEYNHCILRYNIFEDTIALGSPLNSNTSLFVGYDLNLNVKMSDYYNLPNTNKGEYYWLLSNYFNKRRPLW